MIPTDKKVSVVTYNGTEIPLIDGTPTDVATEAEMDALLTTDNEGKCYRYTGATTSNYVNGNLYVVPKIVDIDLGAYCGDDKGWWNKTWTSISGRGTDGNWLWSYRWIPVGDGKVSFDMVIHYLVGHITAWNDTTEVGTYTTTGSTRRTGEWDIPDGTKYLRVERPSGASASFAYNYLKYIGTSRLPYEYQEVEYIESNGLNRVEGAYLDTGLLATSDMCIDMTITPTSESDTDEKFFGVYSSGIFIGHYTRKWRVGGGLNLTAIDVEKDTPTRIVAYGNSWKIGDETATVNSFTNSTKTMLVGACHYDGTNQPEVQYGSARYSQIQIKKSTSTHPYEGSEMLGCFIPCYRKSDGEIGMYDIVTGTFHGKAGSIPFTKGADIY